MLNELSEREAASGLTEGETPLASWLALDWDQDQFHLVLAQTSRHGVQIMKAISWTHPEPFIPSTADRVGKALRDFLKAEKIAAAPVIVGIGRDRILLKELRFPPIAAHEEPALVRFQTAKELTESIEQYAVDYTHLQPESGSTETERQIITVAARRDLVTMIQTLCQAAGLKLHAITPRLFGVASMLAQAVLPDASPLTPKQRNVVLTLGQRWAELCFFRGKRLIQAQALAIGPLLISEIKRNLAVFQAQHAVEMDVTGPECLYVFGDDPASVASLQSGLKLPIVTLDPLAQDAVIAAQTKNPGAFAGSIGLALLWSEMKRRPVNLASPKKQTAPVSVSRQRGMLYGAVAALAAVVLIGCMYTVLAQKRAQVKQLVQAKLQAEKDLEKVGQERADLDAYREWEQTTIPWLDEMYDLSARFPYEVGFRVNQFAAATGSKKNSKDSFVGRITLNGVAPKDKQIFVHQLLTSMDGDPHLRASTDRIKTGVAGTLEFPMRIDIAKQPASKYDTRLKVTRPTAVVAEQPAAKDDEEGDDE